jgi:hypothetical protein
MNLSSQPGAKFLTVRGRTVEDIPGTSTTRLIVAKYVRLTLLIARLPIRSLKRDSRNPRGHDYRSQHEVGL